MRFMHNVHLGSERGSVAVFVASVMLLLMGIAALAVDVGLLQDERSEAQNAADLAALAAAWEDCTGAGDPTTRALGIANANGFDDTSNNTVTVTQTGDEWEVLIDTDSTGAVFSGIWGNSQLATAAVAVAECEEGGAGGYAFFAGDDSCGSDKQFTWSGSNSTVVGNIHSNDGYLIGGSNNNFNGDFTYDDGPGSTSGSGNNFGSGPTANSGVEPYPVDYDINDFGPGATGTPGTPAYQASIAGRFHDAGSNKIDSGWLTSNTTYTGSGLLEPGLYWTTDEIDISGADGGNVTFATPSGIIKVSGSSANFTPYEATGVLMFSDRTGNCDEKAIEMSGSNNNWSGILFAPRGKIVFNGSSNDTLDGSAIGRTIDVSGSSIGVTYNPNYGNGEPVVGLTE